MSHILCGNPLNELEPKPPKSNCIICYVPHKFWLCFAFCTALRNAMRITDTRGNGTNIGGATETTVCDRMEIWPHVRNCIYSLTLAHNSRFDGRLHRYLCLACSCSILHVIKLKNKGAIYLILLHILKRFRLCVYTHYTYTAIQLWAYCRRPTYAQFTVFSLYCEFLIHLALLRIMAFSETLEDNGTI